MVMLSISCVLGQAGQPETVQEAVLLLRANLPSSLQAHLWLAIWIGSCWWCSKPTFSWGSCFNLYALWSAKDDSGWGKGVEIRETKKAEKVGNQKQAEACWKEGLFHYVLGSWATKGSMVFISRHCESRKEFIHKLWRQ